VAQKLEVLVAEKLFDVAAGAGKEIVGAQDFMALIEQAAAKMGADKARAASDQNPFLSQKHVQLHCDCFVSGVCRLKRLPAIS
jgi:hypothetical protein